MMRFNNFLLDFFVGVLGDKFYGSFIRPPFPLFSFFCKKRKRAPLRSGCVQFVVINLIIRIKFN